MWTIHLFIPSLETWNVHVAQADSWFVWFDETRRISDRICSKADLWMCVWFASRSKASSRGGQPVRVSGWKLTKANLNNNPKWLIQAFIMKLAELSNVWRALSKAQCRVWQWPLCDHVVPGINLLRIVETPSRQKTGILSCSLFCSSKYESEMNQSNF